MSVLDRSALEASPLADIHAIASELSIDGYRRLRRPELIDAILDKQAGVEPAAAEPEEQEESAPLGRDESDTEEAGEDEKPTPARRRRARGTAEADEDEKPSPARRRRATETAEADEDEEPAPETGETDEDDEPSPARRRRGRRGGRGRTAGRGERSEAQDEAQHDDETEAGDEQLVEGVVELLANGSGFVRVHPPDASDDDVYVSSAQVKRCELVSGDRIAGPKRAPRRSERFASLIRVETINGQPASELADSVRFDDLPAAFASEQLTLGTEDATLKAIDWLTPIGKGSRVAIVGEARSGKSHTLRRLALALAERDDLTVQVVLAGVRPEELSEWNQGGLAPVAALSFAASEDAQGSAIEPVIDQARRLAARGSDAVVLIDSLDGCSPQLARKALASARNIVDGGSLTVIAATTDPIGGETTVIALDDELTAVGRFPAIDIFASGTLHPELLVGEEGAATIARTRAEALEIASE